MIRIVVDSTSDFTLEEASKYNIDIVPLSIIFKNKSYLDRYDLSANKFYELLEKEDYPTTSQPSPDQFYNVYKKFDENDEIIVLCISSELSGTFQSGKIASEEIKQKIEVIDSKLATISNKLIIMNAVKLRDEGCSFEEIVKNIKEDINRVVLYAGFNTLEYLVKGGRLSKVAGIAGTFLKIKPLITLSNGKIELIKKSRGFNSLVQDMLKNFDSDNVDVNEPIMIGYTKDDSNTKVIVEHLKSKGYKNINYTEIGAVIGVHAGPFAAAISYFKK